MLLDPVILYKDGKSRRIPAIDVPGWINEGWLKEPAPIISIVTPAISTIVPTLDPVSQSESVVIQETQTNKRSK